MTVKGLASTATLLAGLLGAAGAAAQGYPAKPVKVIVPYQAGQGTDVAARYLAEHLTKALGQSFYIDNKPGAAGNIGTEAAAPAAAGGYTLLMGTNRTQALNEFLYASPGFDAGKDFPPILLVGLLPMGITTPRAGELLPGVKSVAERGVRVFEITAWIALYARRGTPEPVVALLSKELLKILAEPDTRQRLLQLGLEPVGSTPAALAE